MAKRFTSFIILMLMCISLPTVMAQNTHFPALAMLMPGTEMDYYAAVESQVLTGENYAPAVKPASADNASTISAVGDITLTVKGQTIRVQNANGNKLLVYSFTGDEKFNVDIEANDVSYTLKLNRGCYIIKVGTVTRKWFIM